LTRIGDAMMAGTTNRADDNVRLQMAGIGKSFGATVALADVGLEVHAG
jgi:ABC-type sugar transport system ATPase subunit